MMKDRRNTICGVENWALQLKLFMTMVFMLLIVQSFCQTTSHLDSLNSLAHDLRFTHPEKSEATAVSVFHLSEKVGYSKGAADALKMRGVLRLFSSDFDEAVDFFHQSLKYYELAKDNIGKAAIVNNLALVYSIQGEYFESLKMHYQSYQLEKSAGNEKGAAQSLDNIGTIHYHIGNERTALRFFIQAVAILYRNLHFEEMSQTLTHLSAIMNDMGYYQASIKVNQMAVYLASQTSQYRTLADAYNNMANAYFHLKNFQMARRNIQIAMEYREFIGDINGMMAAHNIAGAIYREQGDLDLSDLMYINVLKMSQELGNKRQTSTALAEIGENLRLRGDLEKAENYLKESLKISEEMGMKGLSLETLKYMMRLYHQKGETHIALALWYKNKQL